MGAMRDVYADVGRSAATIALRLGRFAEGKRLKDDSVALCPVCEKLRRMSRGPIETEPDDEDPIFTTIEGQVVVIYAAREKLGDPDGGGVKKLLAESSEKMKLLLVR